MWEKRWKEASKRHDICARLNTVRKSWFCQLDLQYVDLTDIKTITERRVVFVFLTFTFSRSGIDPLSNAKSPVIVETFGRHAEKNGSLTSNSTVLIRVVSMSMVEHEDAAEHAAATSVDSSNEIEHRGSAATWLDVIANTATAQATKTVIMRMANPIVLCQKLKRARSSVEAGSVLFLFSARFSKFVFCLV